MTNVLVCAFCVNNENLINILNNDMFPDLGKKIHYCLGIKIDNGARNMKLCTKCARNIDNFASFKSQAREAKSYVDNISKFLKTDVNSNVISELYKKMKTSLNHKPAFLTERNSERKRPIRKRTAALPIEDLASTESQQLISNHNSTSEIDVAFCSGIASSSKTTTAIYNYEEHQNSKNDTQDCIVLIEDSESETSEAKNSISVLSNANSPESDSSVTSRDGCSRTTSFNSIKLKTVKKHIKKKKVISKEFIETDDDSSECSSKLIVYPRKKRAKSSRESKCLSNQADSQNVQIKLENTNTMPLNSTRYSISSADSLIHFETNSSSLRIKCEDELSNVLSPIKKNIINPTEHNYSLPDNINRSTQFKQSNVKQLHEWYIKSRPVFINSSKKSQYLCHLCPKIFSSFKRYLHHLRYNHEIICQMCNKKFRSNGSLLKHQIKNGCLCILSTDRKFILKPVVQLLRSDV